MAAPRPLPPAFWLAAALLSLAAPALAGYGPCTGGPGPDAQPNLNPIFSAPPVLVNVSTYGKLYTAGDAEDAFHILHVYGTPYQMGYAHGSLLRTQLLGIQQELDVYLGQQAQIPGLPKWLNDIVVRDGIFAALAATADITAKYTPNYFFQEIQGLADGSGVPYNKLLWIHMIGELLKVRLFWPLPCTDLLRRLIVRCLAPGVRCGSSMRQSGSPLTGGNRRFLPTTICCSCALSTGTLQARTRPSHLLAAHTCFSNLSFPCCRFFLRFLSQSLGSPATRTIRSSSSITRCPAMVTPSPPVRRVSLSSSCAHRGPPIASGEPLWLPVHLHASRRAAVR